MLAGSAAPVRWSDIAVGAFVLGWLAGAESPLAKRSPLDERLGAPLVLFGAAVLASCAVTVLRLEGGSVPDFLASVHVYVLREFAIFQDTTAGVPEGAALILGLLLFWSTISLSQRDRKLPKSLLVTIVAAAVGAAALSLLVSFGTGPTPMLTQARNLSMRKLAGHLLDVNAAGSYFAMTACLALGMAAASHRTAQVVWLIASGVIGYALWLSGSRIALGAAVVTFCLPILQLRTRQISLTLLRRATFAAMLLAVSAYFVLRASPLSLGRPLGVRFQFVETALRMFATRPIFGVGIGGFYLLSRRFLAPELGWEYALENAHNYFLQIAAELGIVGLALFVWLLVAAWRLIWNAHSRKDPLIIGVAAGLAAFLITCLTGHPLVVHEVAYPLWMTLGLGVALAQPYARATPQRPATVAASARTRWLVAAAIALMFVTVPFRVQPEPVETVTYGVGDWESSASERTRWLRDYSSIIVPSDVTAVTLPLRSPRGVGIEIALDGDQILNVALDGAWRTVEIALPPAPIDTPYRRLDLRLHDIGAGERRVQLGEIGLSPHH